MNRFVLTVALLLSLSCIATAHAHNAKSLNSPQQCYAMAMVGKDTVINARLGLPPEHALKLTRLPVSGHVTHGRSDAKYDTSELDIMLAAYLWHGTPQAYADNVLRDCARNL